MTLEVKVGPPQLATNQGNLVLVTDPDGQITFPSDKGLYFRDTRLISSWSVFANGIEWDLLNSGNVTHYASRIFLTNAAFSTEDGDIPRHVLGLAIGRTLGGGIHEDLDVTNHGPVAVRFNLEIALRCDFADIFEVKAKHIVRRGKITTRWSPAKAQLRTAYRNRDFSRHLSIIAHRCDSRPVHVNGRLSFEVKLPPGGAWHACLLYEPGDGRCRLAAPEQCIERCLDQTSASVCARGRKAFSGSGPAMRKSIGCSRRRSRTWRRCACLSWGRITCNTCPPPACRGSLRCSAGIA